MFKDQKLIGLFHNGSILSSWHILFYDELLLLGDSSKIRSSDQPLLDLGIVKTIDNGIDYESIYRGMFHKELANNKSFAQNLTDQLTLKEMKKCDGMEGLPTMLLKKRLQGRTFLLPDIPNCGDFYDGLKMHLDQELEYEFRRIEAASNSMLINSQLEYINSTQDNSDILLPSLPKIIGPQLASSNSNDDAYMEFVDGLGIRFTRIAVPAIPATELVKFKYEHQDKLNAFRTAFKESFYALSNLPDCVAKMAVSLNDYNSAVEATNLKYKYETMSLNIQTTFDLVSSLDLLTVVPKILKGLIDREKYTVMKQQELLNAKGSETAYIYEIEDYFKRW